MTDEAIPSLESPPFERAQAVMERLFSAADVSRVYGEPVRHGETLVIPAAEVLVAGGFGLGSGGGAGTDPSGRPRRAGGGGGGGGGTTLARTVAVIVSSPEGVSVRPVFDWTKIGLAGLTAAGFVLASWRRLERKRRNGKR